MKNKILIPAYIISSLLFIIGINLAGSNYTFQGYFTGKIINWIWLFLTLTVIILYWKRKGIKIYFYSLLTLVVLSILPMGIPFFAFLNYFTTNQDYQQITINDKYRLVRTNHEALSAVRVYVYEKKDCWKKNIYRTLYSDIITNTIKLDPYKLNLDQRNTPIQSIKFISANDDSLGIEYQILNKKAIYYHKIGDDGY